MDGEHTSSPDLRSAGLAWIVEPLAVFGKFRGDVALDVALGGSKVVVVIIGTLQQQATVQLSLCYLSQPINQLVTAS